MMTDERRAAVHARIQQIVHEQIAQATRLQDVWLLFNASAVVRNADDAERRMMQRAFYTGASCAANLVLNAIVLEDDAETRARMDALYQEFRRFAVDVEVGRA
jgi:hypothetical protein